MKLKVFTMPGESDEYSMDSVNEWLRCPFPKAASSVLVLPMHVALNVMRGSLLKYNMRFYAGFPLLTNGYDISTQERPLQCWSFLCMWRLRGWLVV